jgi:TP901 family phage tail tape measure protein
MATLTSQLIVSLIDRVTAPSRAVATSVDRLRAAQARNAQQLAALRGRMVEAAAVGYALARAITSPVQVAADFQTAMNRVGVLSGATTEQFAALRQQAAELGRTTQFTASQAADAMGFLAMAGFKTNEIMGAMPGTLQLAAAAQMDVARAADIVSNVLTGYGKEVSELGHVNDVLVKAFTSANTDLSQLAEAMKYAGPVASAAGVRFEETAAAISLMGNAGIQGSMAGTSLRGAISRVLNPTKQVRSAMQRAGLSFTDANGRLLPLATIVEQLAPNAEDAGLFMELFGQRAGPAMAALVSQGSAALQELERDLVNAGGTAERVAAAQMEGFNGMKLRFMSMVEGLQIAIGTALLPALISVGETIMSVLGPITAFAEANPRLTATVVGLTASLVALRVAGIAAHWAFLWVKGGAISAALTGMRRLFFAMRVLSLISLTPIVAGFNGLRSALIGYAAAASIAGHGAALKGMGAGLLGLLNPLRLVTVALRALKVALIGTGIGAILVAIAMAGAWIYNNWQGITVAFEAFRGAFMRAIEPVMPALQPVIDGFVALWSWISDLIGPIDAMNGGWAEAGIAAGKFVGEAVVAVIGLPGKIMEAAGQMVEAGKALMRSLLEGIKAGATAVIGYVRDIGSRIAGSVRGAASRAWDNARSAIGFSAPAVEGARAAGGPGGRTYLVGERGMELFTPDRSGYVHDAASTRHMLGAGGGDAAGGVSVSIGNIQINLNGNADASRIAHEIGKRLKEELAGIQSDIEWAVS